MAWTLQFIINIETTQIERMGMVLDWQNKLQGNKMLIVT